MSTVQPDLFGEYDAQQERDRIADLPATCPRCGTTEPNGLLLSINHGIEPGEDTICGWRRGEHPIFGNRCTAQNLVRNHIWYAVVHGLPDSLARAVDRGRTLGLDTDAIIAQAQDEAGLAEEGTA